MIKFLNNFFKLKKAILKINSFQEISLKKFNIYSNHLALIQMKRLRFVGGCVRKIINDEKVTDIDLSTNLNPNSVIEVLKKNKINFHKTGIAHGTITAIIDDSTFEITSLERYKN